jgi:hypothetical protein
LPSQNPSVLHEVGPMSVQVCLGSPLPAGTLVQLPSEPVRPHDLQVLLHALWQQ